MTEICSFAETCTVLEAARRLANGNRALVEQHIQEACVEGPGPKGLIGPRTCGYYLLYMSLDSEGKHKLKASLEAAQE